MDMNQDNNYSPSIFGLDFDSTAPTSTAEYIDLSDEATGSSSSDSDPSENLKEEATESNDLYVSPERLSSRTGFDRKRMSLMHPEKPHHDYTNKNKQQSGDSFGPRRNPRRANICPIDHENFVMNQNAARTGNSLKQKLFRRTLKKRGTSRNIRNVQPKASVKTRSGTLLMSTIGAIYNPPSPLSTIPRRTWQDDLKDPDETSILPEPVEEETFGQLIHHIFHAIVDFGLLMTSGSIIHRMNEDKMRYVETLLRRTPYDHYVTTDPCEHSYDINYTCHRGELCTAMMRKVRLLCARIRQLIVAVIAHSMEADIERILKGGTKIPTGNAAHSETSKKVEIESLGLKPVIQNWFYPQSVDVITDSDEDDDDDPKDGNGLIESLLTEASLLYCITNDIKAEHLAAYLEAYPVKVVTL